ncbi:toll/interleukin-1 receptor domain-containing protein [Mycolicibacterium pulveris]|uniref:toll/interleukin-1 receptor domain-containing protein n=1 Tax=Mycolicibacterium pulveris TaxID=36813 RepID=UPI003CF0251E
MRYDAFISYSHAADGRLAPELQRALQRLAKPWYRRRSLEVFRDETGLAVDPHLWNAIVRALDDAEWFLLLTSPQAAASVWVNREIEHWKAHRPVDRILPVVTDGHWEWDPEKGDFTDDSDAVPPALRGVFTDEPRHLDLRWAHEEDQLDLRNSRFRNAVAEVAAPLHGRTKDEIEGEDVRQHRRTKRIAWSAVSALAVLTVAAIAGAGIAVYNANQAEQRRVQAEAQRLAAQSRTELERPDLAFLLAAHGYRMHQSVQTEGALLTAVANLPEFKQRVPVGAPVTAVAVSDAADRVWIGTADGRVLAQNFTTGAETGAADDQFVREVVAMAPAAAGADAVVVTDGTVVATLDGALRRAVVRTPADAVSALATQPATGRIAAGTVTGGVIVWNADSATPTTTFPVVEQPVTALAWMPDGGLVVAGRDGAVRRFDVASPERPAWVQPEATERLGWVTALTVVDDGTVVTGGSDGTVGFLNGADGTPTAAGLNKLHADAVTGLVTTGDGAEAGSVASVSDDGFLIYWNHLTGSPPLPPLRVDEQAATSVAWDPANPDQGVTGGTAGGALLLDYGEDRRRPLAQPVEGWSDAVAVAISPAADRLAVVRASVEPSGSGESAQGQLVTELTLTDVTDPDPAGATVTIEGMVDQVVFSADGARVLASTTEGDVVVWDGVAQAPTTTRVAPGEPASQLAVSPDGVTVATRWMNTQSQSFDAAPVRLWRLDGDRLVEQGQIDGPPLGFGLAFTPDGSRLVIGGSGELVIHRLADGSATTVELVDDETRSLAVAPDGKTIAVSLWSGPVRLFDTESGEPTGDDLRVAKRVTDVAFRGNGELATVSEDGSIIFWDLTSRTRLSDRPLTAVDRSAGSGFALAPSLALTRDVALTASVADRRLIRWSLDPTDWIAEGCAVHQRDLTDAEKDRYDLEGADPICEGDQKNR